MFHRSELGMFAALLPCDGNLQVPEPGDDWRCMHWGLELVDTCDADVIELMDDIWWPQLVKLVDEVREKVRRMSISATPNEDCLPEEPGNCC
jgi:hypothetical protein